MNNTVIESNIFYPASWSDADGQFEVRQYFNERRRYFLLKRIFDVIVSLLIMLFLFPWLVPILMVLIKLDSRGPVFFRQKRVGFLGRTFWCYKFRTMRVNDSADSRRAYHNDPRVTRVGWFLRNTCLDELPQFINVLTGTMSIVGPRPHMLKDSREFSNAIDNYKFRNLARPGITGISQVRGYRGPAANFESILRRYQWDAYYIRNNSFLLDCKIMFGTGALMFRALLNKDNPVPLDSPVLSQPGKQAQKIA